MKVRPSPDSIPELDVNYWKSEKELTAFCPSGSDVWSKRVL